MKNRLKRALTTVAAVAAVAAAAPLLTATPAFAAGVSQSPGATINQPGGAGLKQSGDGTAAGNFTLRLPAGAACPGDGIAGWSVTSFMTLGDPSTLQFDGSGPTTTGTGTTFVQALRDASGNPITGLAPNAGDGVIVNIPNMGFSTFSLGDFDTTVTRVYNIGLACILGPASGTQMNKFWSVQMTVTPNAAGGPPQIHWENGTTPSAPTLVSATPSAIAAATGQVSVVFTNPSANPSLTGCTLFVGTSAGGTQFSGAGGTPTSCTSPSVVTGLTYGTPYFFRLASTNSVGTSAQSNELSATAVRPAVANLSAAPTPNTVSLNWDDAALLGADSYNVDVCTLPATSPCNSAAAGWVTPTLHPATSDLVFTGSPGQLYAFTVSYGATGSSLVNTIQSTPLSNSILIQDITVGRPNGALVLTQQCGKWDAMTAESPQFGFPDGLGVSAASATGSIPTGESAGSYAQYPYPENPDGTANPTYPTHCGIALGNAHLISHGGAANGAGQFFAASGRLNQVTIVDARDTDPGWTVNFTMSNLTSGPNTISGNELGWTALESDTPAFLDGFGNSYDQQVGYATQSMAPNTQGSAGAGTAHAVIQALDANPGLGIATLDARIKLLIPVHAKNGNYSGTLTINAL